MSLIKLEYIEATGAQYIDTGFIPTGKTEVEVDWEPKSTGNNNFLFGVRYIRQPRDPNSYTIFLNSAGGYVTEYFGTRQVKTISSVYSRTFIKFGVNSSIGSINFSFSESSNKCNGTLYICEVHNVEASGIEGTYCTGKIYSFKIWDDGVLVRDFIPCAQDNVPGLYDNVNKVFYPSVTENDFLAGPKLNNINGNVKVGNEWRSIDMIYIKANGQWKEADGVYVNNNGQWKQSS